MKLNESGVYVHETQDVNAGPAHIGIVWTRAQEVAPLTAEEVHVWKIDIARFAPDFHHLLAKLNERERQKAGAFRFDRDRVRYVVAHGTLRTLLGRYLDTDPGTIQFRHNSYGKPALAPPSARHEVHFNLSHSDNLALLALGLGCEIGVDVERIRPEMTGEDIARHFFAPGEVVALKQVESGRRPEAFFACWTRKEAYIKARGRGLSIPLDSFEVSLVPGEPAQLLRVADEPEAVDQWHLHSLSVDREYAGALATEGAVSAVICREWTGA